MGKKILIMERVHVFPQRSESSRQKTALKLNTEWLTAGKSEISCYVLRQEWEQSITFRNSYVKHNINMKFILYLMHYFDDGHLIIPDRQT